MGGSNGSDNALWIFGYGSLCWHPGFIYTKSMTGYVKGFGRRFWQGNITHRGTIEKPGRVATLIEDKEGTVHGRAFQIQDSSALPYLEKRECSLGGYLTTIATFHSRDGSKNFPVVIYIATNKNEHWLGEASLQSIATQITECSGPSGHNVEYLLRLAEFMHRYLPEAEDEHLFTLELLVRAKVKESNLCLELLMGNRDFKIDLEENESETSEQSQDIERDVAQARENFLEYVSRVPTNPLRCVRRH